MIVETNIGKLDGSILVKLRSELHDALVGTRQVSHNDPPLQVDGRQQI